VERSIATATTGAAAALRLRLERLDAAWIGLGFVVLALAVYVLSNPSRGNFYNHFAWQADAFLSGDVAIRWPVESGPQQNGYFQDVLPLADRPGRAIIPFPPLPAIVLLPVVALFGLAADAALVAALFGALNVGLAWRLCSRLTSDRLAAALATIFFGFGTVHWYAAMLGSTWFLAHILAVTFVLLGITAALDGERREAAQRMAGRLAAPARRLLELIEPRQFLAGLLFGIAGLARLTTLFGGAFFLFVGAGGSIGRRGLSAALGAVLPLFVLLAYNLAATDSLFNPAYQHLYQTEIRPAPDGGLAQLVPELTGITYHPGEWAIEDVRYLPQNLLIALGWLPVWRPECGAFFDVECPLLRPDRIGMSLFLTSPAYLLALPLVWREWRRRIVLGAALAVAGIALINLAHFSQGWVQFGYRFSNDFAPFALVLVTLAIARSGVSRLAVALVASSIVINAWGVWWGVNLGW
jgi:hypothetical protein